MLPLLKDQFNYYYLLHTRCCSMYIFKWVTYLIKTANVCHSAACVKIKEKILKRAGIVKMFSQYASHFLCLFISFPVKKAAKQVSRLFPSRELFACRHFSVFLMKRNGPFCGEEKFFQRTMTRDEVALTPSDAPEWQAKSDLTCNSSKHADTRARKSS